MKKLICEFCGTLVLTLVGCGVAVLSEADLVATSLAFGLAVVAMAYSAGSVSGGHFNPAITIGMLIDGRIKSGEATGYIVAQFIGAIVGALVLFVILSCSDLGTGAMGANGFGDSSAVGLNFFGALIVEIVLTFIFVYTALVASKEAGNLAGLVIGLALVLVHLIGIKLTGTSVNPARSFGPALFSGWSAIGQVWVFIVAPIIGAILAGIKYKMIHK